MTASPQAKSPYPNRDGSCIRVVFLTFYYEAWDSLAEVHRLMAQDERFAVTVVAIDRRLTGDSGFGGVTEVSAFFAANGIEHLVNADLAELNPDYIFVNYPWQRNYPHQYRPDALAKIARIVYLPYFSLPLVVEPVDGRNPETGFAEIAAHLYTQRMHQLAALIFVADEATRNAYAGTSRGKEHVHFVGSTKLDTLVSSISSVRKTVPQKNHRHTLVWAPHHSYSPHWLNFGNFASSYETMLDWAKAHPSTKVLLRPHPFLFGTLVDRKVLTEAALTDWLVRWNALPNTEIDSESSAAEIFARADQLLTDGISFLAEWPLATKEPAIFLENPEHWKFNDIGLLAKASSVRITSIAELDDALEAVRADRKNRAVEIKALQEAALPYPGSAAKKIIETVCEDFYSGSELIDPSTITETAWELQPGREPLD